MGDPNVPYVSERVTLAPGDLDNWPVNGLTDTAAGPCPRCGHTTTSPLQSEAVAAGPGRPPTAADFTRLFECACNNSHKLGDGSQQSCGRWWLVTVRPEGTTPRLVPAADDTMLGPALALASESSQAIINVQSAAEKWIAGVTAIFTLFGLVGVLTGKDALVGLATELKITVILLTLAAWVAAALALFLVYRAAYGWPRVIDVRSNQRTRDWFRNHLGRTKAAADNLRRGIGLALLSLLLLGAGVGTLLLSPKRPPAPVVSITLQDSSTICGEFVSSTTAGQLRVRRTNGSVQDVPATQIVRSQVIKACAGAR